MKLSKGGAVLFQPVQYNEDICLPRNVWEQIHVLEHMKILLVLVEPIVDNS